MQGASPLRDTDVFLIQSLKLENSRRRAARGRPAGTFKSRTQLSYGSLVGTLYRPVLDLYERAATQLGLV